MSLLKLFIKPISWSSVNQTIDVIKKNYGLGSCIEIFGYTSDGRTVYVRLPRRSTFILTFAEEVDDNMIDGIYEIFNAISIKKSQLDNKILIVRAPELSPIQLTANPYFEELATWIESKQDPYGDLESLWEAREIGPYEWITINKFVPLPGKYTDCDLNLTADETNIESIPLMEIELPEIFPKLFFWHINIAVNNYGEFPNSINSKDYISMISIITVSKEKTNSYVIVNGDIMCSAKDMVIIRVKDEKDLISQFFGLYSTFNPDRQIYYNGDMLDMPYLLDRAILNNYIIPPISKILSGDACITQHEYITPFGNENSQTIKSPGVEIIDLIHYYRRFYPYFNNYQLETVSNKNIHELIYDDIYKIHKLWNIDDIQERLENICNNLGVSIDTILHKNFEEIIDRACFNIDVGTAVIGGSKERPKHLRDAIRGIYRNVYIYDYSELYRLLMINSNQQIASILGNRLEGAPPSLIMTAFYSRHIDRTDLSSSLKNILDEVIGKKTVISLESTIIKSIAPLVTANTGCYTGWLKLLNNIPSYISVAKASYITFDDDEKVEISGFDKLCRPKFKLINDILLQYISRIYDNTFIEFAIPKIEDQSFDNFILTQKIGDIVSCDNPSSPASIDNEIKFKLLSQYGSPVSTLITVKYIMMKRGPILLSNINESDIIDYNYYIMEIEKYIKSLQSLKVYGI